MSDAVIRIGYNDAPVQAGLPKTAASVQRFAVQTRGLFTALRSGFAVLGVGAGVAGIKALIQDADRIGDLARQLDVSAESVQRLGFMAKLSGSDMESVSKALNRVNRELAEGDGVDVFEQLGIDVGRYLALDADKQIIMLARAFQQAGVSGNGLAQAYALFGKSASELLPLLRENVEQLEEASSVEVISDLQIEQMQRLNDEFDKLTQKADTFFKKSVNGWAEMLKYAKDWLIGGFDANGQALLPSEHADKKLLERAEDEGKPRGKMAIDPGEKEDPAAKREADLLAKRAESAKELEEDMKVLELRAGGHKRAADHMEREIKIRREGVKIAKETGMNEDDALKAARSRADLEDKMNRRGKGGHTIKGYTNKQREEGKRGSALQEWESDKQVPFWDKHGGQFRNLDAMKNRTGPIGPDPVKRQASAHAQAIAARRANGNQTMEQKLDRLIENTAPLKDK